MYSALTEAVQQVLERQFGAGESMPEWERPQEASHGDLATPIALQLSKKLGRKPQEIAEALAEALDALDSVEKAQVAGPGYVNVWLTPVALLQSLNETRQACTARVKQPDSKPIIVDYSQPNIAKPLGVHHILSTVIGQSIVNLYRHLGHEVVGINHIGDWGTQFGKLAVAFELWGEKPLEEHSLDDLLALYVRFHEEAEKDETLDDKGRESFKKLEQGDKDLENFRQGVVDITMKQMDELYERLHVSFDHIHGESFYEDKMAPIIEEGKEKGVFVEGKDGALVVEFPEETNLTPAIVLKADGATIYMTRDLATMRYRIDTWHPEAILYVVDVAQEYYFRQHFEIVRQLQWDLPDIEHVMFGRMRFADKKMSTRKGNILRLEEVLDEAVQRAEAKIAEHGESIQTDDAKDLAEMMGVGAVVYGVLSQNRKMDLVFDWDKMLSFDGNSAPYLQYTHARAKSVLRKGEYSEDASFPEEIDALTDSERVLLNTLSQFEGVLEAARDARMPHLLANYLYQLCQDFNAFYNAEPILKAQGTQRELRLSLTAHTAQVLKAGAEILTIRVPERM